MRRREGKGQGFTDLWKDGFEELNETFDTIVFFPELRAKSQYTQETASGLQELTNRGRSNQGVQFLFYHPEELSAVLHVRRGPKLAVNFGRAQSLGPRVFKPVLPVQNMGLQARHTTQKVYVIDRVRLGVFEVRLRVVEPPFSAKQDRQFPMNPKQEIVPVESGGDSEGYLVHQ